MKDLSSNFVRLAGITLLVTLAISLGVGKKAAQAQTLFGLAHSGPNGPRPSTLYTINPNTGAATAVGLTGFEECSGMDFDASGTLFATCEQNDGTLTHVLITIDPTTGAGTGIGPTGVGGGDFPLIAFETVSDISFRNSDGVLYAHLEPFNFLATIDVNTAAATLLPSFVPTGFIGNGNGIAFSPDDIDLFHSDEFTLNILDQGTGAGGSIDFLMFLPPTGVLLDFPQFVNAMDFDPLTEMLFASVDTGPDFSGPSFLATVDTATGDVTIIGQTVDGLDAIAFAPAAEVPFAVFEIEKARVRWHEKANEYRFEVRGRIELRDQSDGLDVLNEVVTVKFDGYTGTIPAGSFFSEDDGDGEKFEFEGPSGGITKIKIETEEDGEENGEEDGVIEFEVKARGLALGSLTNPVSFSLQIGDDIGETGILFDDKGRFRQ